MLRPILLRSALLLTVTLTIAGAAASSARATSASGAGAPRRVLGVGDTVAMYTDSQAALGLEVFTAVCSECHEVEDLTNEDFRLNWDNTTLYELFDNIRTTMPDENPGTLTPQQYIDVTAYVLQLNKLPAGDVAFTGDSASASAVRLPLPPVGH